MIVMDKFISFILLLFILISCFPSENFKDGREGNELCGLWTIEKSETIETNELLLNGYKTDFKSRSSNIA